MYRHNPALINQQTARDIEAWGHAETEQVPKWGPGLVSSVPPLYDEIDKMEQQMMDAMFIDFKPLLGPDGKPIVFHSTPKSEPNAFDASPRDQG